MTNINRGDRWGLNRYNVPLLVVVMLAVVATFVGLVRHSPPLKLFGQLLYGGWATAWGAIILVKPGALRAKQQPDARGLPKYAGYMILAGGVIILFLGIVDLVARL